MPHDDDRFRAPSDNVVDFPNADEVIEKLADLPEIEYDQHRNAEAKRLGVRREILDRAVKAKRGDGEEAPFVLPEPEPWPEPVDGDDLLDQLGAKYREYLVLPDGGEVILSLWTIHTHTYDTGVISPRLAIQSPDRRSSRMGQANT